MANANNQYPLQPVNLSLTDSSGDNTEQSAINQWFKNQNGLLNSFEIANTVNGHTPTWVSNERSTFDRVGPITDMVVLDRGRGHTVAPTLTITDGGSGARLRLITNNSPTAFLQVESVNVIDGGAGYSNNTVLTIPDPLNNGFNNRIFDTANVALNIEGGVIRSANVVDPGNGYSAVQQNTDLVITDAGHGTGATATANVDPGIIESCTPTNFRNPRYTSVPTVTVTGGGGSGAVLRPIVSQGHVLRLDVVDPGSGYTSAPTITFSGGAGTGQHPSWTANVRHGPITGLNITNGGTNYVSPRVEISEPAANSSFTTSRGTVLPFTRNNLSVSPVHQFQMSTSGDESKYFQRLVPSQTANSSIYSLPFSDPRVSQYTNIEIDYSVSNVYFIDMIQRTQSFTIVRTTETTSGGDSVTYGSVENVNLSLNVDVDKSFDAGVSTSTVDLSSLGTGISLPGLPDVPNPSVPEPEITQHEQEQIRSAGSLSEFFSGGLGSLAGTPDDIDIPVAEIDQEALFGEFIGLGGQTDVSENLSESLDEQISDVFGAGYGAETFDFSDKSTISLQIASASASINKFIKNPVTSLVVSFEGVVERNARRAAVNRELDRRRGTNETLGNEFSRSSGGSPSAPPGPRPGSELPSRGDDPDGPSGQGQEHSSPIPSRQGVRGSQGPVTTRTVVNLPLQYLINAPRNMEPGQHVDIYFRHNDSSQTSRAVSPAFTVGRNISPFGIESLRSRGGLITNVTTQSGSRNLYSVNNEIVGVRITRLHNGEHTISKLGIWPNRPTL